jgi:hypothetical protein
MTTESLLDIAARISKSGAVAPGDVIAVRREVYGNDGLVSREEAEGIFAIERARTLHLDDWSNVFVEAITDYLLNQEPPSGYMSVENAEWVMAQIKRRKEPSTDGDLALVTNLIEQARQVPAAFSAFALRLTKEAVVYGDGPDARGRPHGHGKVTEADVIMLRRILWGAGSEGLLAVSQDEAEALFAIADATTGADNVAEFDDLFARAIGNYLIGATGRSVPPRDLALRWETEKPYKADVVAALSRVLASSPQAIRPEFMKETMRNVRTLSEDIELRHDKDNQAREAAMAAAEIITPEKAGWLLDRVNKNGVMNGPEKALVRFIAREASALDASLSGIIDRVA